MRIILTVLAFIILTLPSAATAGEVVACGIPQSADDPEIYVSTETADFCDYYQRQLAYREENLKLKQQLKARQESFAAPRRAAIKQYEADLKALNQSR